MAKSFIRPALVLFVVMTALTGFLYPLLVTGVATGLFPVKVAGSLLEQDGVVVGSSLIGQSFSDPKYFWGRRSATGPMPYNAAASSGSNQGPLNPALLEAAESRVAALREADPGNSAPVPVDLVTASGSGLDPHISIAAALYQLPRVARIRSLEVEQVRQLVAANTERSVPGFVGPPRVNVLALNRALDGLASAK
jgi:potassium-transporting ATPase KdpC subunit